MVEYDVVFEVQRLEPRYLLRVPVAIVSRRSSSLFFTEDLNYSGFFLRTDTPPPVRGLVRIEVILEDGAQLPMTGMVVHVIRPGQHGRTPGIGIKFYGVGGPSLTSWVDFVKQLRHVHPECEEKTVIVQPSEARTRELVDRDDPRFAAVLEVRVKTLDDLAQMYTRDISRGGTFLTTALSLQVGNQLFVEFVHPDTEDLFGLECVVRRVVRDGVGVEFSNLDPLRRQALWDFIDPQIDYEEYELVLEVEGQDN